MNFLIYGLHFSVITGILYLIFKTTFKSERLWLVLAALLKILAGIALGFIYLYYFSGGDSLRYFEEAEALLKEANISIWDILTTNYNTESSIFANQPRAQFFLQITCLIYLFAYGNFWLTSIYFSLISYFGALYFYHSIIRIFDISKAVLLIGIFFWPSIVFWSSGIIKESISLALIFLISGSFIRALFIKKSLVIHLVYILVGSFLLFKIKYYYAAVLVPVLFAFAISFLSGRVFSNKPVYLNILIFFGVLGLCIFVSTLLHPNLSVGRIVEVMVNNYYLFEAKSAPGKMVIFESLTPHISDLLYYSPKALFAGWFRPFLWDIRNAWSAVAAVENFVLFILVVFQLKNAKNAGNLVVISVLVYCLIMAVFLSYSAPNFGTLVRYKVGFSPFLVLLAMYKNPLFLWIKRKSGIN